LLLLLFLLVLMVLLAPTGLRVRLLLLELVLLQPAFLELLSLASVPLYEDAPR
jgi:hypothetical protein